MKTNIYPNLLAVTYINKHQQLEEELLLILLADDKGHKPKKQISSVKLLRFLKMIKIHYKIIY